MFAHLLPTVVVVVLFGAVVGAVSNRLRSRQLQPALLSAPNPAARRLIRWGLGGIGFLVFVAAAELLGQRAIFLVAPLAMSGYLVGVLSGDLMLPRPAGGPLRHVSLAPRTSRSYLAFRWVWVWRSAAAAAAVAIAVAGIAGSADGRSFELACGSSYFSGGSPWPGWSYGGPALVALVLGGLLVEFAIRRALVRPRPDPSLMDLATDEAERAVSLRRAVAAGIPIALVPLAGVALSAAVILGNACSSNRLPWTMPAAIGLAILAFFAGVGALAGLAALVSTEGALVEVVVEEGPDGGRRWN